MAVVCHGALPVARAVRSKSVLRRALLVLVGAPSPGDRPKSARRLAGGVIADDSESPQALRMAGGQASAMCTSEAAGPGGRALPPQLGHDSRRPAGQAPLASPQTGAAPRGRPGPPKPGIAAAGSASTGPPEAGGRPRRGGAAQACGVRKAPGRPQVVSGNLKRSKYIPATLCTRRTMRICSLFQPVSPLARAYGRTQFLLLRLRSARTPYLIACALVGQFDHTAISILMDLCGSYPTSSRSSIVKPSIEFTCRTTRTCGRPCARNTCGKTVRARAYVACIIIIASDALPC